MTTHDVLTMAFDASCGLTIGFAISWACHRYYCR